MNILLHLLCISFVKDSLGHGGMYYPFPWHTSNYDQKLKTLDPEEMSPWKVRFETVLPKPNNSMPICEGKWPKCHFHMYRAEWGSTNANVKEVTLDEAMYDDKMDKKRPWWTKTCPWSAPGQAKIPCNDGCGVNGLNPCGCNGEACEKNSKDACPKIDVTKLEYGKCCKSCKGCNDCPHYDGGKSAMRFWEDGFYTTANTPIITWTQGEPALVEWMMTAQHRGGYAYRLCKVPSDGVSGITEDCFANGHLDFAKDMKSFVFHLPSGKSHKTFDPNTSWIERTIVTTRNGTKPDNSEWAKINLPGLYKMEDGKMIDVPRTDYSDNNWKCDKLCRKKMKEDGVIDGIRGKWVFKDYVEIPEERFSTGKYVLSFRWDSQKKPQVWNSCANIEIVEKK